MEDETGSGNDPLEPRPTKFCINCGANLPVEAKFCPDCGRETLLPPVTSAEASEPVQAATLSAIPDEPPSTTPAGPPFAIPGEPAPTIPTAAGSTQVQNKRPVTPWVLLAIILSASAFAVPVLEENTGKIEPVLRVGAVIAGLVFVFLLMVIFLVRIIKGPRRVASTIGVIFAVLLAVSNVIALNFAFEGTRANDASVLRDYVAEASIIKSLGDDVVAGRSAQAGNVSLATLRARAKKVATAVSAVTVPKGLRAYRTAASNWATAIGNATTAAAWRNLSAQPAAADLSGLSMPFAVKYLRSSVDRIRILRESGEYAMLQKDITTTRRVASRILAEKHWLEGLSTSSQSLAAAETSNGQVLAMGRDTGWLQSNQPTRKPSKPRPRRPVCYWVTGGKRVCANTLAQSLGPVWRSSLGYVAGAGDAREQWTDSWSDINEEGVPLGGAGITQGEPDKTWNSPFLAECRAKGGSSTGTSVKERLPTTEGGWTCQYPHGGQTCWDFLTYSGSRYMGGNGGCPEMGLVPRVPQPQPQTPAASWDGTYDLRATGGGCGYTLGSLPIGPHGGTMTVHDSVVDGYMRIDASGRASYVMRQSIEGGSVSVSYVLQFSHQGNGVIVSGSMRAQGSSSYGGQRVSVNCSVTYSGNRVSS